MTPFIRRTKEAAEQIYRLLRQGWKERYGLKGSVGAGGDRTAGIDSLAESIYVEALSSFGRIDSEERGSVGEGRDTIVLDPIDGSSNALSGLPYYGSSVALQRDGETVEAVVVNLANGDIFAKADGGLMSGRLEEEGWRPVVARESSEIGIFEKAYADPLLALALLNEKRKFRSPGAVALSLAYAHYVDFVIFAGPRRPYDFAAALRMCEDLVIIEEARLLIVAKEEETANHLQRLAHRRKDEA